MPQVMDRFTFLAAYEGTGTNGTAVRVLFQHQFEPMLFVVVKIFPDPTPVSVKFWKTSDIIADTRFWSTRSVVTQSPRLDAFVRRARAIANTMFSSALI